MQIQQYKDIDEDNFKYQDIIIEERHKAIQDL